MKISNNPFLLLLMFVTILFGCNGQSKETTVETEPIFKRVNIEEFDAMLKTKQVQLLDVRTAGEYQRGFIASAQLLDYHQQSAFMKGLENLDKSKPVLVYCAVGGRSAAAAKILKEKGFKEVYDLAPGFNGWEGAGKNISYPK